MAGRFTNKRYDECAFAQSTKQSTDPIHLTMDINKFVNCNNICQPTGYRPPNAIQLVDIESSLWGLDKLASNCDTAKHPFCSPSGCLLTNDPRVAPHINPQSCSWGHTGQPGVVTTNMSMPTNAGFTAPNPNICTTHNGFYSK